MKAHRSLKDCKSYCGKGEKICSKLTDNFEDPAELGDNYIEMTFICAITRFSCLSMGE
jgi:hypothetical protein